MGLLMLVWDVLFSEYLFDYDLCLYFIMEFGFLMNYVCLL